MLDRYHYHELLKKYTVIFGALFNNIDVVRRGNDGSIEQTLNVPLAYGPKEKFLARLQIDPNKIEREAAIQLPRISFENTSMVYAPNRKLNTHNKYYNNQGSIGSGTYRKVWEPVPYDLTFQLNIMTKTVEDGNQIIEQIVPYFTPDWTIQSYLLKDLFPSLSRDIPITLTSAMSEDTYEGDFKTRRALIWTLDFMMKVYFYGPSSESKVIKFIDIDLYAGSNNQADGETVTIQPGLTSNGEPTTNESESIHYLNIDEDDNYGYIVKIQGINQ